MLLEEFDTLYNFYSFENFADKKESHYFYDDFIEMTSFHGPSIREDKEEKSIFNERPSAFHLGDLASGENFNNLADNNEVILEHFKQNINENKNNTISVTEKNNDESFLDSFEINSSEILINYYNNNEEEEIDLSFYNSINYFNFRNNNKSKLSKNNENNS